MTSTELFSCLQQALGTPALDARSACTVTSPTGDEVTLQMHPDDGLVRFIAAIGGARVDAKRPLLVAGLLCNTALAAQTPFHVGFDPDRQRLALCLSMPARNLAPEDVRQAVQVLCETATQQRQQFQRQGVIDA